MIELKSSSVISMAASSAQAWCVTLRVVSRCTFREESYLACKGNGLFILERQFAVDRDAEFCPLVRGRNKMRHFDTIDKGVYEDFWPIIFASQSRIAPGASTFARNKKYTPKPPSILHLTHARFGP